MKTAGLVVITLLASNIAFAESTSETLPSPVKMGSASSSYTGGSDPRLANYHAPGDGLPAPVQPHAAKPGNHPIAMQSSAPVPDYSVLQEGGIMRTSHKGW